MAEQDNTEKYVPEVRHFWSFTLGTYFSLLAVSATHSCFVMSSAAKFYQL